jgi:hypothetical protein
VNAREGSAAAHAHASTIVRGFGDAAAGVEAGAEFGDHADGKLAKLNGPHVGSSAALGVTSLITQAPTGKFTVLEPLLTEETRWLRFGGDPVYRPWLHHARR